MVGLGFQAPSIPLVTGLLDMGARVRAHDPVGMEQARKELPDIEYCEDPYECVRGADALIVNPTHLAVAIHYDEDGEGAPEVLAKGADHLAQKMIAAAREAGVPVLRDIPLARSLYELSLAWQEREAAEDLRAPLGDQEPSAP